MLNRTKVFCVAALLWTGCGPVRYLELATRETSKTLAEAGALGAARASPYEWTQALLYLDKARELAGYARWQDALLCARKANQIAHQLTAAP